MRILRDRLELLDALELKGKSCVEIGVLRGEFSREILKRDPGSLLLVDPWEMQPIGVYLNDPANTLDLARYYIDVRNDLGKDSRIKIIRSYSLFAAQDVPDKSCDFVYIDAIHSFGSCLSDLVSWFPKIKQDGWLCCHDYTGGYQGVRQAVDFFLKISHQELGYITTEDFASCAIRIKDWNNG